MDTKQFFTVPELARLLGVTVQRARYGVIKLAFEVPRAGAVRMIPVAWLPAIRDAMSEDRRRKVRPKPRVRLRLTD